MGFEELPEGHVKANGSMHIESVVGLPMEAGIESQLFELSRNIQEAILHALNPNDVFALRISSRRAYNMVETHQASLARRYMKLQADRRRCDCKIWTPPKDLSLSYYYQSYHHQVVLWKVASAMLDFIAVEIHGFSTKSTLSTFQQDHAMLLSNLYPILEHISLFLEEYQSSFANATKLSAFAGKSPKQVRHTHHRLELAILERFNDKCLCECYAMFRLLLIALSRRLRPPINATKLERSLRGWNRPAATSDDLVKLLLFGGLSKAARILSIQSYAARREHLDTFLAHLRPGPASTVTRPSQKLSQLAGQSRASSASNGPLLPSFRNGSGGTGRVKLAPLTTLPALDLHLTPAVSQTTISQMCPHLPGIHSILVPVSEQLVLHRGYIDTPDQLPSTRRFVQWASSSRPDMTAGESIAGEGAADQIEADSSLTYDGNDADAEDDFTCYDDSEQQALR